MKSRVSLLFLLSLAALTGCAVGGKHAYHSAVPSLQQAQRGTQIALAVHDRRAEVRSGDKNPNFVGLLRGGYGNPFDTRTATKAPLATDMATSIRHGLQNAGYQVTLVQVEPDLTPQQATAALTATGAPRVLLVSLAAWKSDTYQNTALIYDVDAQVMDARGKMLGRAHREGRDNLGGAMWNPGKHARTAVLDAYRAKIAELLAAPDVARALQGAPSGRAQLSRGSW